MRISDSKAEKIRIKSPRLWVLAQIFIRLFIKDSDDMSNTLPGNS
jgi:hypothetical protein